VIAPTLQRKVSAEAGGLLVQLLPLLAFWHAVASLPSQDLTPFAFRALVPTAILTMSAVESPSFRSYESPIVTSLPVVLAKRLVGFVFGPIEVYLAHAPVP
jgi:hypothetical protein